LHVKAHEERFVRYPEGNHKESQDKKQLETPATIIEVG